jgi:hypothetical protein
MAILAAVGLLSGLVLAQFFKAFVLLPSTVAGLVSIVITDLAVGHSLNRLMIGCACVAFALQFGYLLGVVLRGLLVSAQSHSFTAGSSGLRSRSPASRRR